MPNVDTNNFGDEQISTIGRCNWKSLRFIDLRICLMKKTGTILVRLAANISARPRWKASEELI